MISIIKQKNKINFNNNLVKKKFISSISFQYSSQNQNENTQRTLSSLTPSHNLKSKVFSIEGITGCGKSTLLRIIQKNINDIQVIREPVENWKAINGNPKLNILDAFFHDQNRWGYTFQTYTLLSRIKQWEEINKEKSFIFFERCVISDKYIFALYEYKARILNEIEWSLYNMLYNLLVDGIIYLSVKPEICYERVQKRARNEEIGTLELEFLQDLHKRHEELITQKKIKMEENIPFLIIDGNKEFEKDEIRQKEILSQINGFLKNDK